MKRFLIPVCALLMIATGGCDRLEMMAYNGWQKYVDVQDGYTVLIPPGWEVTDGTLLNFRGSRFERTNDEHIGTQVVFIFYGAFVRDAPSITDFEAFADRAVNDVTAGLWESKTWEKIPGSLDGSPAMTYLLRGEPRFTRARLRAEAHAVLHQGKLFVFLASATESSWDDLVNEYAMITGSIKLP